MEKTQVHIVINYDRGDTFCGQSADKDSVYAEVGSFFFSQAVLDSPGYTFCTLCKQDPRVSLLLLSNTDL